MPQENIFTDFWNDPYVFALPPKGKLVLLYVRTYQVFRLPIILEDMAHQTGVDITECAGWTDRFSREIITSGVAV